MAPCAPVAQSAMRRPTLGGRRLPSGRAALPYRRLGHKIISPGCSYDARFCHPQDERGSTYRGKRPSRFGGGTGGDENPPPRCFLRVCLRVPFVRDASCNIYVGTFLDTDQTYIVTHAGEQTSRYLMNQRCRQLPKTRTHVPHCFNPLPRLPLTRVPQDLQCHGRTPPPSGGCGSPQTRPQAD